MARFYGWTDYEIKNLTSKTFYEYWLGITVIESEEIMLGIKVSTYPHLKKTDANKVFRELQSIPNRMLERERQSSFSYEDAIKSIEANDGN